MRVFFILFGSSSFTTCLRSSALWSVVITLTRPMSSKEIRYLIKYFMTSHLKQTKLKKINRRERNLDGDNNLGHIYLYFLHNHQMWPNSQVHSSRKWWAHEGPNGLLGPKSKASCTLWRKITKYIDGWFKVQTKANYKNETRN